MLRILLVEDEPDLAKVVTIILEEAGYHVTVAHDGQAGLTIALQERPELVITDFMMPRLDGLAMIEQLRRADFFSPIVLCTAVAEAELPASTRGYDAYLGKPYLAADLLDAVSTLRV